MSCPTLTAICETISIQWLRKVETLSLTENLRQKFEIFYLQPLSTQSDWACLMLQRGIGTANLQLLMKHTLFLIQVHSEEVNKMHFILLIQFNCKTRYYF